MDNNDDLGLIKLPDAATLTARLNEGGFSDLVTKTEIINLLAEQKKSFENVNTIIDIARREYLVKITETNASTTTSTKSMCELILSAKTESLSKLILQDSERSSAMIELLQGLGEIMPSVGIFMTTESDSE